MSNTASSSDDTYSDDDYSNEASRLDSDDEKEQNEIELHSYKLESFHCLLCEFIVRARGDDVLQSNQELNEKDDNPLHLLPSYLSLTLGGKRLLEHLLQVHSLVIADAEKIAYLPDYLVYWKKLMEGKPIEEYTSSINTQSSADSNKLFYLLSDIVKEDKDIRSQLQKQRLDYLLRMQEEERQDNNFHRKCLFCKQTFDDRKKLFAHMYQLHSFNIGLLDNLVCVNYFLDALQQKVSKSVCIYCEKTFKSHSVLKLHMRKKKHFKLNRKSKEYDRFYMINYLEEGKNWEALHKEMSDSDNESVSDVDSRVEEDNWDEWSGEEGQEDAKCLYCEMGYPTPSATLDHMKNAHNFDLQEIRKEQKIDFYSSIKLINYIRKQVMERSCPFCGLKHSSNDELVDHMKREEHYKVNQDMSFKNETQYLIPVIEGDPLLRIFDTFESDEDLDESAPVEGEEIDFEKLTINGDLLSECQ